MPNRVPLDDKTARWLPWVVAIAFFMQSLDGTILNTALPAMARDLAENPLRMQGVVIAYMLTVALLIPASGWIADRFGTKKIFFGAIMLFSIGSLLCALSSSLTMLVGARVIQGLGGALMLPVGRLVVLRAYPRSELVRIMGFITIPGLLGPLLGSGIAPSLFAIALLACGLNSTVTATLAGQAVMEGFLQIRLPPWLRRLITRAIAIIPAAGVTLYYGSAGTGRLLILTQVILSLQLSFAVVPLVMFTANRAKMGALAAPRWLVALAILIAVVIIALNAKLLWDFIS